MLRGCLKQSVRFALWALALVAMGGALAAPAEAPAAPPAYATEQELGSWSKELQSELLRPDGQRADVQAEVPTPAKLLREHLGLPRQPSGRESGPIQPQIAPRPVTDPARQAPDREIERAVKDAVRPIVDELSKFSVVEAARNLKSEFGLRSDRPGVPVDRADPLEADGSENDSAREQRITNASNRPVADARYQTADQAKGERLLAQAMMEQLIQDVKPWAFGLLGLYLLGYIVKLALDYHHWKVTRGDKRLRTHQPIKGNTWVTPRHRRRRRAP